MYFLPLFDKCEVRLFTKPSTVSNLYCNINTFFFSTSCFKINLLSVIFVYLFLWVCLDRDSSQSSWSLSTWSPWSANSTKLKRKSPESEACSWAVRAAQVSFTWGSDLVKFLSDVLWMLAGKPQTGTESRETISSCRGDAFLRSIGPWPRHSRILKRPSDPLKPFETPKIPINLPGSFRIPQSLQRKSPRTLQKTPAEKKSLTDLRSALQLHAFTSQKMNNDFNHRTIWCSPEASSCHKHSEIGSKHRFCPHWRVSIYSSA